VLEIVDGEEQVLSLNLPHRTGELVGKEFDEDHAGELLVLFSRTPLLLAPLAKDLGETCEGCPVVIDLGVPPGDLEAFSYEVWDISSGKRVRVQVEGVNLLSKVYKTS
jgi:hypothetical protein